MLCFPRWLRCRCQWVNKRMHVAKGDVVFFIPEGGRKNHIRIVGCGIHSYVKVHQEVKLPDGRIFFPFDLIHQVFCRLFVPHHIIMRTEPVLERQFMPSHTGSNEVSTIHGDHFQLILGSIYIMDSKIVCAILKSLQNPVLHFIICFAPRFDSFVIDLERILLINLREERQPP